MTGDFADGHKKFNTAGSLYKRTYLTENVKIILNEYIDETLSITMDMDEDEFQRVMTAMTYLKFKLKRDVSIKPKMSRTLAKTLYFWVGDMFKYTVGEDYDKTAQWVTNLWCRDYSVANLMK